MPPRPPWRHRGARLGGQHALDDIDPRRTQPRDPGAVGAWIGIARRDHHAGEPGCDQQVATRRAAVAGVGAGFEADIDGRSPRGVPRRRKRDRFGVRAAAGLGPATRDHLAVPDDQAADIGVRRRSRPPAPRQRDRGGHPVGVGWHRGPHQGCFCPAGADCGPRAARSASVERVLAGSGFFIAVAAAASPNVSRVTRSASVES